MEQLQELIENLLDDIHNYSPEQGQKRQDEYNFIKQNLDK